MEHPIVSRADASEVLEEEWGRLTWHASANLGNAKAMTVGQAVIRPGIKSWMVWPI